MDLDDLFPDKPDDPLTRLKKQDLDPLSVEELQARIELLEGEIARVKAKMDASISFRASAEDLAELRDQQYAALRDAVVAADARASEHAREASIAFCISEAPKGFPWAAREATHKA